jgi:hypothetical protein
MNRQQLRVVREPEQPEQGGGGEGEDKDKKADAPKRKQRISSVSPERKAGLTLLALPVQKYKY